ncbi:MAG TPA: tetratricopeptide repeat protein [Burkholderiales bacterium]|jgi:tetratricopeptide (TPR) repeat protein|nr:tetratricopeptide repeat protein [Burkholderiales bacterium]
MEPAVIPADPMATSGTVGRGDTYEEREAIGELAKKKDWAGMLRFAEAQQKRNPAGSDWVLIAGYAWLRRGEYPKATAAFAQVIQQNPEDIGAWNLLGESQRRSGQPGQATRTLERASAIGRTSYATFFFLGEAYRDSNRLDRAIPAYREAARLEPELAQAWFELGSAYARTGQREEALRALERLEKVDPALGKDLKKQLESKGR